MFPPPADLLADLVRRPSVNPMGRTDIPADLAYESRVTDYLEAQLKSLGVEYRRHPVAPGRDNLVARYAPPDPPGPPGRTYLWECHQDTVPTDGMTIDPFAAAVTGGRLAGRGACDVKAGAAAMLSAFGRLVRDRPAGSAAVILAFTVDEEHTFLGVQHLVRFGIAADAAVVAEPTGLDIVTAHKGVVRWSLETDGVACHSSMPERGANAVYGMARLITGVEAHAADLRAGPADPVLGPPSISVGVVHGGVSPNTVPDRCRIDLDRRLVPGETPAGAVARLDQALAAACPGVAYRTLPVTFACPALAPTLSADLVARLGAAIDAVRGRHETAAVPYGTDASTLAEVGIPVVVFGPGDIAQAHTKDEWVELAQVDAAADILYRLAAAG